MRTKILAAFVAGGLLVGAGVLTTVVSSPGTARAQEQTESENHGPIPHILGLLGEVLDDLVDEGTITDDQADAIEEAAEDKATELRDEALALREQLSGILDDGVITADEVSELPDNHWLFGDAFDEAWEDGELSSEDIGEVRSHRFGQPFKHGFRFGDGGGLLDDGGIDEEEYESLPDDHPLKQVDASEYLEDGLITPDEFREVFSDLGDTRYGDDA